MHGVSVYYKAPVATHTTLLAYQRLICIKLCATFCTLLQARALGF